MTLIVIRVQRTYNNLQIELVMNTYTHTDTHIHGQLNFHMYIKNFAMSCGLVKKYTENKWIV